MAVGKALKRIVDEQGITLKQLAEKAGISVQTLYSITSRDSAYVRRDTLQKIAAALNLTSSEMMRMSIDSSDSRTAESLSADQRGQPQPETKASLEFPGEEQNILKPGFAKLHISDTHFEAILKNLGYSLDFDGKRFALRCPDGLILNVDRDEIFELMRKTSEQLRLLLLDLRERKQAHGTQ